MKIKVLHRTEQDFTRERKEDVVQVFRSQNPIQHPFERAREYTRALNATKLEKVFAKPFVGQLEGHTDGICSMSKLPTSISSLISGSCDGEIRVWDLPRNRTLHRFQGAHDGLVQGVTASPDGQYCLSCGTDKTVKSWSLKVDDDGFDSTAQQNLGPSIAHNTWMGSEPFTGIDHHWRRDLFATAGIKVDVWDHHRSAPVQSFSWGTDSLVAVKFNAIERDLVLATSSDRGIMLYDLRANTVVHKLVMIMKTNSICWNPMEAFNFSTANEDHNCYTFDTRKMDKARNVHKDHVSAVMDLDYSPTGKEFVTGSYDRTLRIFPVDQGRSREVYHTRRMQRIFCARFSSDSKYVLCGSDDMNIRVWKSDASAPIKKLKPREEAGLKYNKKLKDRFKHMPEINRIARHKHLPKAVLSATKLKRTMENAKKRKLSNKRAHAAEGAVPHPIERKKHSLAVVD